MQPHGHVSHPASNWLTTVALQGSTSLTYSTLMQLKRRSLRNGGWARLEIAEKGLFRCALWIAKARNRITNTRLMVQVLRIALKLFKSFQSRIAKAGKARATMMLQEYARAGRSIHMDAPNERMAARSQVHRVPWCIRGERVE